MSKSKVVGLGWDKWTPGLNIPTDRPTEKQESAC